MAELDDVLINGEFKQSDIFEILDNMYDNDLFKEFIEWRSKYKMYNYTNNNQLLLYAQARVRNLTPVFKTLLQWNQEYPYGKETKKGVRVKEGERACLIIKPRDEKYLVIDKKMMDKWTELKLHDPEFSKYFKDRIVQASDDNAKYNNYYDEHNSANKDKMSVWLRSNKKNEKIISQIYKKVVSEGIGVVATGKKFNKSGELFSIDQTDYPEEKRANYIKRFDIEEYNPVEGEKVYKNLTTIANKLGINVVEGNDQHAHSGYIQIQTGKIYILNTMPVESKVGVLAHELGHYILQKNINNFAYKYENDNSNYEIQAELFSNLFCSNYDILQKDKLDAEGNKICDENGKTIKERSWWSNRYLSSYLRELKKTLRITKRGSLIDEYNKTMEDATTEEIDKKVEEGIKDMAKKMFFMDFNACDKASFLLKKSVSALEEGNEADLKKCLEDMQNYKGVDFEWNKKTKTWFTQRGNDKPLSLDNFVIHGNGEVIQSEEQNDETIKNEKGGMDND